ncbi:hypothetical protein CRUP_027750, partial [Coryphaenoides rupestris]
MIFRWFFHEGQISVAEISLQVNKEKRLQNKSSFKARSRDSTVYRHPGENMEDSAGDHPQSAGFTEKLKSWLSWSWTYICFIWFGMVLIMIYVLRSPLKLQETFTSASVFLNTLTPKFYVALTGTSSLISGLIL